MYALEFNYELIFFRKDPLDFMALEPSVGPGPPILARPVPGRGTGPGSDASSSPTCGSTGVGCPAPYWLQLLVLQQTVWTKLQKYRVTYLLF